MSDTAPAPASQRDGWLSRNRIVPIVTASALFMDLMDSSALALALPTIARHFNIASVELKLALTAYLVTVAVFVPTSGWVAGRFGAKRVFIAAMMLFMLGSMLCGMANNIEQLVVARIIQGLGGSMMTPVGRAIMVRSVDRETLVRAMAWFTLPAVLAPLTGPPFAGLLLEIANWRWIFFINIPVGLLSILAILKFVPHMEPEARRSFDMAGFLLCAASILAVMILLETNGLHHFAWPVRIVGFAAAVLLPVLYVRQARRAVSPIIDLRVLRHPTFRLGLLSTWFQRVALGGLLLVIPLQMQIGLGLSPLVASQVPVGGAIGSIISRFTCPPALRLMGFRTLMLLTAIATTLLSIIPSFFTNHTWVLWMCLFMGCHAWVRATFFMAGSALAYADVDEKDIGHASVLFSISQQLSLGFGIMIAGAVLTAAGGPEFTQAYYWVYPLLALLPLAAATASSRLPRGVGAHLHSGTPR